jgi:hypothetical protein
MPVPVYLTQLVQDQMTRPMMRWGFLSFSKAKGGYSGLSDTSTQWVSVWKTLLMAQPPSSSNITAKMALGKGVTSVGSMMTMDPLALAGIMG